MLKLISGGSAYGARLITDQAFRRGAVIYRIEGYRITEQPTYQTIQVGRQQHIEELGVIAYFNHSCQPTLLYQSACARDDFRDAGPVGHGRTGRLNRLGGRTSTH